MKKIISLALALVFVLSLHPVAFAARDEKFTITSETCEHGSIGINGDNIEAKANAGDPIKITVTPEEGYKLKSLKFNGVDVTSQVSGGSYSFDMPGENVILSAVFDKSYAVKLLNVLLNTSKTNAYAGDEVTISVSASPGYALDTLTINGTNVSGQVLNSQYTFTMPENDINVNATFKASEYAIVTAATANGSIEVSNSAIGGATVKVKATPGFGYNLNELYYIEDGKTAQVNISKNADGEYIFVMPDNKIIIYSSFTDEFTAMLGVAGSARGKLYFEDSKSVSLSSKAGKDIVFLAKTVSDGYRLGSIKICDISGKEYPFEVLSEVDCSYYFTMPTADVTITAIFIPEGTNAISIKSATNGTIAAELSAKSGDTVTLTLDADEGYIIGDLVVYEQNGKVIELTRRLSKQYTFKMPESDVTIFSSFIPVSDAHSVSVKSSQNGVVVSSAINAVSGKIVSIMPVEDSFYELKAIEVISGYQAISADKKTDGSYTFKMPDSDVSVTPTFGQKRVINFYDIAVTDWYYEEVKYVFEHGIMNGMSETAFEPDTSITRGMIVTMLYRLEGEPSYTKIATMPDVLGGVYYCDAVYWAQSAGVVTGYDTGYFGPGDAISREQLAAILFRYASIKRFDTSQKLNISGFADYQNISAYAQTAVGWAYSNGIVAGKTSTTMSPRENATRAEVAVSFARLCKNIAGM